MAAIIVPSRRVWTQSPLDSFLLDESQWCAGFYAKGNGVVALPDGGNPQSVSLGTDSNIIVGGVGPLGPCIQPTGQTRSTVRLESTAARINTPWSRPSGQVTVLCVFRRAGNPAGNAPIFANTSPNTSPYAAWGIVERNSSGYLGFEFSTNGVSRTVYTQNPVIANTAPHVAIGVYDGATAALYLDGKLVAGPLATYGDLTYSSATDRGPAVGNFWQYTGAARSFIGEIYAGAVSDRALSVEQIRLYSENHRLIFRPRRRRSFFLPPESGGIILDASATGQASADGQAGLSAQVALSGVGVAVSGGTAGVTVAVPLSATGIAIASGSAGALVMVSIAAAGLAEAAGAAGLSAEVLLSGAGAARAAGNATLAAQLEALAAGGAKASGTAAPVSELPGMLSASGGASASGQADLKVRVDLQAAATAEAGGSAQLTTTVTITAAGFVHAIGTGTWQAELPLAAFGNVAAWGSATATLYAPGDMPTQPAGMTITVDSVIGMDMNVEPQGRLTMGVIHAG
ncbi:LamG-like jellyroll fold domain-containing protein [Azonexus sp.]|jgi:hypothetical protein|uniref:LamG-like jellyroll fold domain-containing protein n=1 Tax=Azonexus sp. TaxID=1872668 RepID=UPI002826AD51|nr:LamG-like jellyroll fold domain-containing protein [Azonexus sp.]MDR1995149.1 LamG domain-containing protein [Azonexus sp.]